MVFIRAEIEAINLSGQKRVHLIANNADGIVFWTDNKSIVNPQEFANEIMKSYAKNMINHIEFLKDKGIGIADTSARYLADYVIQQLKVTANIDLFSPHNNRCF